MQAQEAGRRPGSATPAATTARPRGRASRSTAARRSLRARRRSLPRARRARSTSRARPTTARRAVGAAGRVALRRPAGRAGSSRARRRGGSRIRVRRRRASTGTGGAVSPRSARRPALQGRAAVAPLNSSGTDSMLTCSQSRARARTRSAWPSPGSPSASRRRSTLADDLPAPRPTFPTLLPPVAYPPSRSLLVALARSRPRPVVVVARLAPSRPPPPSRSRSLSLAYPLLFPSSSTFLLSSDTTPFVRPPCLVNSPKSGHARRPPYPLVLPRPQPLFRNLARRLCSSGATYLRSTTPRTCISEGDIARSVRRPSRPRSPRRLFVSASLSLSLSLSFLALTSSRSQQHTPPCTSPSLRSPSPRPSLSSQRSKSPRRLRSSSAAQRR